MQDKPIYLEFEIMSGTIEAFKRFQVAKGNANDVSPEDLLVLCNHGVLLWSLRNEKYVETFIGVQLSNLIVEKNL
jgi:hypothetical protein